MAEKEHRMSPNISERMLEETGKPDMATDMQLATEKLLTML